MKTVKLSTIIDLLNYYEQICDEDVEISTHILCTIESLIPFESEEAHVEWMDKVEFGYNLIPDTYDYLWNAALRDYHLLTDMLKGAEFGEWSIDAIGFRTSSTVRWDNDAKKPVATILIDAPFIGYDHIDEWVWQGVRFDDFIEDTTADLTRKIKQIANKLGKEAQLNG